MKVPEVVKVEGMLPSFSKFSSNTLSDCGLVVKLVNAL